MLTLLLRATAALNVNFTQVQQLGALWNDTTMQETATKLLQNGTTANAGNLVGNRMFYDNDYMVSILVCEPNILLTQTPGSTRQKVRHHGEDDFSPLGQHGMRQPS